MTTNGAIGTTPAASGPATASNGAADPSFEAASFEAPAPIDDERFIVDVGGFEGPLDLLLALARAQKVDLARISILELVDQYLAFVERVRARRLELAADHLVMAAWLAYLKSRLLVPSPPADDEPSGEELAAALAFRLQRLEAMRSASAQLMARTRLGVDVFARGAPELTGTTVATEWQASLYDLLSAYGSFRQRTAAIPVKVAVRTVWSLAEAREILERLVGAVGDWTPVATLLAGYLTPGVRATVLASTFSASLELVREGRMELRQADAFAPLYARARAAGERDGEDGAGRAEP